jgi:hypothetical protein
LTGGSLGFSKIGTGTINFGLAKKDGFYRSKEADFYGGLLDHAAQIHVVIQDAHDQRAWLVNAERTILHLIVHHYTLKKAQRQNKSLRLAVGTPEDPGSIRKAMLQNRETVIEDDQHLKKTEVTEKRFRHMVEELYTIIDALEAFQAEYAKNATSVELGFDKASHTYGWQYMDLVKKKNSMHLRDAKLESTCGGWPKLMRDIDAVVLFGVHFGEVIQPTTNTRLCGGFQLLPKGKDLLAMEVSTLQELYEEGGSSRDFAQITHNGAHLRRSKDIFRSCAKRTGSGSKASCDCTCERIQEIGWKKGSENKRITERSSGAIIVGGKTSMLSNLFNKKKSYTGYSASSGSGQQKRHRKSSGGYKTAKCPGAATQEELFALVLIEVPSSQNFAESSKSRAAVSNNLSFGSIEVFYSRTREASQGY